MPTSDDAFVLPLDAADATLERVGGKGASLARLARAGLPVPPGFHVTTAAYRRFVSANGLQPRIVAIANSASADDPASLERAASQIGELFAAGKMPAGIAEAIRAAYPATGPGGAPPPAVAVRSSATAEDLPELSFAGQQESYLNVRGPDDVVDAVRRCWASLWTARAIGYRLRQGIPHDDVSLAAVVQTLVPADAAGVLFTVDPVTGARETLIDAAWGLGESVVGGLVTPDRVRVDRTGAVVAQQVADKTTRVVTAAEGTRAEPVPDAERRAPVLARRQAAELARLGERIERLWGRPMDVEWAVRDGTTYVLQARPITALPAPGADRAAPQPAELDWSVPDPHAKYYRASVVELLADPLSPLFATLALPSWNAAMADLMGTPDVPFGLTTINGYAYYGLRLPPSFLVRLIPLTGRLLSWLGRAEAVWDVAARRPYADVVGRWQAADLATTPAGELLAGAEVITAAAARHYVTIQGTMLPAANLSEALFTATYERLIRRRGDPPAVTFLVGFESTPIRADESLWRLGAWVRDHPELASWLDATGTRHVQALLEEGAAPPALAPATWQAFAQRLRDHLARFGHTVYDLDFARPVPADDPAPIIDEVRRFAGGAATDPVARRRTAAAAREAATARMLARLREPRRTLFRRLLAPAQRYGPLREDALAEVGLGWPVLRRIVRELGRRLVAGGAIERRDDAFWLTVDELRGAAGVLDAGRPVANHGAAIGDRKAAAARHARAIPPPFLPLRGGATFFGVDWSRWLPARLPEPDGAIRGIGTSPGRVTGTARVVRGPEEFDRMRPGEILVARITTPAWTPLFALAAGLVTDVGGPLSHGSIVAREYGIPAVLGTGVATDRIRSGDRITVDGEAGTVRPAG